MTKTKKLILILLFVVVELFLYLQILFFHSAQQNIICYTSIALCFGFSLILFQKKIDVVLVELGLLFTLIADTFLVLLNSMYLEIAMVSFVIVQLIYFVRIILTSPKKLNIFNVILRLFLFMSLLIVALLTSTNNVSFLIIISLFYFANLFCNVIFSFFTKPKNLIFAFGLMLFMFCDFFVGLPFVVQFFNLSASSFLYQLNNIHFNLIWAFYLPSQVLIVLSTQKNRNKKIDF